MKQVKSVCLENLVENDYDGFRIKKENQNANLCPPEIEIGGNTYYKTILETCITYKYHKQDTEHLSSEHKNHLLDCAREDYRA